MYNPNPNSYGEVLTPQCDCVFGDRALRGNCVCVLAAQSCPILCDPMDCRPPGSSVHGILQARILECAAMPFSRGSFRLRVQPASPALQADSLPLSHHGSVGKHTEKQFVYLSQQLGRNTHPERKDTGVLSNEEG